ncbi:hypothetical protein VaNZ11_006379 [Volvox africanus]|uniref:von Hippel-Lindau disease tumour suppressor beta domain-containing protein n=1 Tax=Volvox africanus TaxID=51714 RepID=A0ABQ5S1P7_9CHLO|nr:hypothetical protein VaNZ11_006379 [Volvox africanus]
MGISHSLDRLRAAMESTAEQPPNSRTWLFEDGDKVSSVNSRFAVNMCYTNRTNHIVEAFWLNFEGKEISYGLIKPGATHLLYTFLTHPWVFRKYGNHEEVLTVHGKPVAWPNQTHPFVDIEEAPIVPWNMAAHASTFKSVDPVFARDVQNLLRAYYIQRKANGRSSGVKGCRSGTGKSRRSSTGGMLDAEASPTKGGVPCCGVKLWHWRGLENCNSLQTAPTIHATTRATVAVATQLSAGGCPPFAPLDTLTYPLTLSQSCAQLQPEDGLIGKLPFDIILEIIERMAPPLRNYKAVLKDDIEMMPRGVEPDKGPVAFMASRLLGPIPPPAPLADPQVWFAAVNNGAHAAAVPEGFNDLGAPMVGNGPLLPQQQQMQQQPDNAQTRQVAEVLLYVEATVLANAAMAHSYQMEVQQEVQAAALMRFLWAQVSAEQTLQQQQQDQQDDGGRQGLPQERDGLAVVDDEQGVGSQYGDAVDDRELEHRDDAAGAQVGAAESDDEVFQDANAGW